MSIQSFANETVRRFFEEERVDPKLGWAGISAVARRKLDMLHYAETLLDVARVPGNRLEALKGRLKGRHSVRINDQWRIVFRWTETGPAQVDIVDYH